MKNLILSFLILANTAFAVTANKVWRVPSGATTPSWGAVNLASTSAITGQIPSKSYLPDVGQQISSAGSLTTTNSGNTDVPSVTVTLTTIGRPVLIILQSGSTAGSFSCIISGNSCGLIINVVRDSTDISDTFFDANAVGSSAVNFTWPVSFQYIDVPSAGSHTYKLQIRSVNGSAHATNVQMAAFEL